MTSVHFCHFVRNNSNNLGTKLGVVASWLLLGRKTSFLLSWQESSSYFPKCLVLIAGLALLLHQFLFNGPLGSCSTLGFFGQCMAFAQWHFWWKCWTTLSFSSSRQFGLLEIMREIMTCALYCCKWRRWKNWKGTSNGQLWTVYSLKR